MEQLPKVLVNPQSHIKKWIKDELMNFDSLNLAMQEKDACISRR